MSTQTFKRGLVEGGGRKKMFNFVLNTNMYFKSNRNVHINVYKRLNLHGPTKIK